MGRQKEITDKLAREWKNQLDEWIEAGLPAEGDPDFESAPRPREHPRSDHLWNSDWQQYLRE